MAPNITSQTLLLASETETGKATVPSAKSSTAEVDSKDEDYKWKICWKNVLGFMYLHYTALYAVLLMLTGHVKFLTVLWCGSVGVATAMGITAGAHRLWAHRCYKATWQLRLILAMLQTVAFQNHIYEWVRDHRVHHKFTDTDADPHNAKRGFFFSHMGWLLIRKHPDVKLKGKTVDMSDLDEDPIVVWQRRLYLLLMPICCFVVPSLIPWFVWNESFWISWYVNIFRYVLSLNFTWLVNSAAHIWGTKPYDKTISPVENIGVAICAMGEGWHNYHHVFPWDYKAAELGNYKVNFSTAFIDFFAKIGWAYDLKTVPTHMIKSRSQRTGDGSLKDGDDDFHHMNNLWGWGDSDMSEEHKRFAEVQHPKID